MTKTEQLNKIYYDLIIKCQLHYDKLCANQKKSIDVEEDYFIIEYVNAVSGLYEDALVTSLGINEIVISEGKRVSFEDLSFPSRLDVLEIYENLKL